MVWNDVKQKMIFKVTALFIYSAILESGRKTLQKLIAVQLNVRLLENLLPINCVQNLTFAHQKAYFRCNH